MDLEETSVVMADQAVARTSSLGLEVWARAVGVEEGTQVDETGGMAVGMEVPGEMTIGIVIVITMEEAMTEGEATTEVGGVAIVNVGEEAGEVVEAAVGDTEPHPKLS